MPDSSLGPVCGKARGRRKRKARERGYLSLNVISDESLCKSRAPVDFKALHENFGTDFCHCGRCTRTERKMEGSHKFARGVREMLVWRGALRMLSHCFLV